MAETEEPRRFGIGGEKTAEVAEQLERVFLAGLGALSKPADLGTITFESLIQHGEEYRDKASEKTEALIDEVREAIREMAGDAESRATGLLEQIRSEMPSMEKIQDLFDSRVAGTLRQLSMATKKDIDDLDAKLDKILKQVEGPKKPAKRASKKKVAKKAKKKTKKKAKKKTKRKTKKKTKKKAKKKTKRKTKKRAKKKTRKKARR